MPLLGKTAMHLSFDAVDEAIAVHDDGHAQEHLPERLSSPGFLGGIRWVTLQGQPRAFVQQEVADLGTLATGYDPVALLALQQADLGSHWRAEHGASDVVTVLHRTDCTLTASEIGASASSAHV